MLVFGPYIIHYAVNIINNTPKSYRFTSKELFPERYNQLTQLYGLDKVIVREEKEIPDGMIKCNKCRSYKTTYYETNKLTNQLTN